MHSLCGRGGTAWLPKASLLAASMLQVAQQEPHLMQLPASGTIKAFFRGNGTNVLKIAPETAIKLTFNDRIKRTIVPDLDNITPLQRMSCGALAGAVAQACTLLRLLGSPVAARIRSHTT